MNTDEEWQSLKIKSYSTLNSHLGDLIIDDNGQKWFYIGKGGGIIVYNDNDTPEISTDDQDKRTNHNSRKRRLTIKLRLFFGKR
jgi:hypothetical protein